MIDEKISGANIEAPHKKITDYVDSIITAYTEKQKDLKGHHGKWEKIHSESREPSMALNDEGPNAAEDFEEEDIKDNFLEEWREIPDEHKEAVKSEKSSKRKGLIPCSTHPTHLLAIIIP